MCATSEIYKYIEKYPIETWNKEKFNKLNDLIYAAEEFDKIMDETNCEDKEKYKVYDIVFNHLYDNEKFPIIDNFKIKGLI